MGMLGWQEWIQLINHLLLLECWSEKSVFSRDELSKAKQLIPVLIKKSKVRVNRQHGDKLAIPKFHLMIHLTDDILRFGAPCNTNSGVGEADHKHNVKSAARKTQCIVDVLDQQTGTRTILQFHYQFLFMFQGFPFFAKPVA